MTDFDEEELLVLRFIDGRPIVPLAVSVLHLEAIIPAVLAPHLQHSRIAGRWAAGVELSEGAAIAVQLFSGYGDHAEPWGEGEILVPEIDPDLDETDIEAFMLGGDFLSKFTVHLLGPNEMLVLQPGTAGQSS